MTGPAGDEHGSGAGPDRGGARAGPAPLRLLARMRIRKKLIFLHTVFFVALAGILLLALRPALADVVREAEAHESRMALALVRAAGPGVREAVGESVRLQEGTAEELGLSEPLASAARADPGAIVSVTRPAGPRGTPAAAVYDAERGRFLVASAALPEAERAVVRLYVLVMLALLAVYALIAAALEVFVLPQHVYGPIALMQQADEAVRAGRRDEELIPEVLIPGDELGAIMRSRNESIGALRRHERDLAHALGQLERAAIDLRRKNHLLEMARRKFADADRLVSLGLMSAGLAHEMNTPLAVIKGLAERLQRAPARGLTPDEAALLTRVVGRLERLSESLLDFARVRPPRLRPTALGALVEEAWTLVRLDREAHGVTFVSSVPPGLVVPCDGDRIVQVLVNLLRNAVEAVEAQPPARRRIEVDAALADREGRQWASLTVADSGPGIDPEVLGRLFEPFVSTRLDDRGTGLGLAVSEGIVREHAGLLLARNRDDGDGAVFEIMLPVDVESGSEPADAGDARAPEHQRAGGGGAA